MNKRQRIRKTEYSVRAGRAMNGFGIAGAGPRLYGQSECTASAGLRDYIGSAMRIAVLADFHNGSPEAVLRVVRADVPDIIMIPGDLMGGYYPKDDLLMTEYCSSVLPLLRDCTRLAPTYVSLGNHECVLCDEDLALIRSTGAVLLDNSWVKLTNTKRPLVIGGLTSGHMMDYRKFREEYLRERNLTGDTCTCPHAKKGEDCETDLRRPDGQEHGRNALRYPRRNRTEDPGKLPAVTDWLSDFEKEDGFKILLSHHPEYWEMREPVLRDRNIDLVLSGHAHGGQWNIFGRGVYAPGQGFWPEYTSGEFEGPHGRMIVSRGMTNSSWPVPRIGNPCEILYIEIEL